MPEEGTKLENMPDLPKSWVSLGAVGSLFGLGVTWAYLGVPNGNVAIAIVSITGVLGGASEYYKKKLTDLGE